MDTETSSPQKKAVFPVKADGKVDAAALVEQYTPFVKKIAAKIKKTLSKNIEFDDLMSYGMTGLLEAAERFDASKGANFMTFSYYRVRGAIYDGLRGMGWVNRSEYQKIRFEERASAYLDNMARREAGSTAEHKSVETNVEELANQVSQLVTIYVTSLEGMENAQFEDEKALPPDRALADMQMRDYVRDAIGKLPEQDRTIITLYYFHDHNLEEVGKKLGLSKSWTSRRHAQAIDKLGRVLQEMVQDLE